MQYYVMIIKFMKTENNLNVCVRYTLTLCGINKLRHKMETVTELRYKKAEQP